MAWVFLRALVTLAAVLAWIGPHFFLDVSSVILLRACGLPRDSGLWLVKLLAHGADVNFASFHGGRSPLIASTLAGNVRVCEALLALGASIDQPDWDKPPNTALSAAARMGHVDVARLLLAQGAQLNPALGRASNPLVMASRYGHDVVVSLLLEAGANIEPLPTTEGPSPRYTDSPLIAACSMGHEHIVTRLLDLGANASAAYSGVEPLFVAAYRGHVDIVRLLFDRGAMPDCATLQYALVLTKDGLGFPIVTEALDLLFRLSGDLYLSCGSPELVEWVGLWRVAVASTAAATADKGRHEEGASGGQHGRRTQRPAAPTSRGGDSPAFAASDGDSHSGGGAAAPAPPPLPSSSAPGALPPGNALTSNCGLALGLLLYCIIFLPLDLLLISLALLEAAFSGLCALTLTELSLLIGSIIFVIPWRRATPNNPPNQQLPGMAALPLLPNAASSRASHLTVARPKAAPCSTSAPSPPKRSALAASAPQSHDHGQAAAPAPDAAVPQEPRRKARRRGRAHAGQLPSAMEPQAALSPQQSTANDVAAALCEPTLATADTDTVTCAATMAAQKEPDPEATATGADAGEAEREPAKRCAQCGAGKSATIKLSKCSGCQAVRYCSAACQARHWREGGHKQQCRRR